MYKELVSSEYRATQTSGWTSGSQGGVSDLICAFNRVHRCAPTSLVQSSQLVYDVQLCLL